MKKSELVRAAKKLVRRHGDQRVCYCTPNRRMVFAVEQTCMNENMGTPAERRSVTAELCSTIAEKLRELSGRWHENEPLREFDTEDTPAAYALTDKIVDDAFDKAAMAFEQSGD